MDDSLTPLRLGLDMGKEALFIDGAIHCDGIDHLDHSPRLGK